MLRSRLLSTKNLRDIKKKNDVYGWISLLAAEILSLRYQLKKTKEELGKANVAIAQS